MTTIKKDLRSGASVWTSYATPRIPGKNLRTDIKADVAVIGAGITGALMAEELSDAGFSVVVLDRRPPLHGSTMASTALLQYEIDVPLGKLSAKIGYEQAARTWRRSKMALASLADRTRILGIACQLREESSLYIAGDMLDADALREEQTLRQQAGFQTRFLNRKDLKNDFGINAKAALQSFGGYSANPYQLAYGYLKKSMARGTRVFSPVEITNIETSPRRVYLHTKQGMAITARYAVYTTGFEVPEELKNQDYQILSTWAFATKPQDIPAHMPMIWESSDPYLYIRRTPDGRLICGGEDEEFTDEEKRIALTDKKIKTMQKKIKRLLPALNNGADYSWSGAFGSTPTALPLIGAVPGLPNCFAVMAFGGNGITSGRMGAEMIRAFLTGHEDPDFDLYKFRE